MSDAARCIGAIIAGGRATRFDGGAKGLERVGGVRIIDRVATVLRAACDEIVIVANDAAAGEWIPGVRVVADVRQGDGSLGGVHAALATASHATLVCPWDAPFVPAGLLLALREAGEAQDADAAVPLSRSRRGFEPLCAWYRVSCLAAIERRLEAGDLRAGGWQDDVTTVRVDASPWGDPDEIFFNVNTAADLSLAESLSRRAP